MANNHAAKKAEKRPAKSKARPSPQKVRTPKVSRGGGGPGPLRRLVTSIWTWRIILLVAFIALLAWQWDNISEVINNLITGTYGALGWGFILIVLALIVAVSVLFRESLAPFARRWTLNYWYRWAGALVLLFAIWGILGFFSLGGSVGQNIVGDDVALGVFKILGFVLLALILLFPAIAWRALKKIVGGLVGLFRMPAPRSYPAGMPASGAKSVASVTESERVTTSESPSGAHVKEGVNPSQRKMGLPSFGGSAEKPVKEPLRKAEPETSTAAPRQPAQQVALDVWRKYGESSRVVVIDGWKLPPIEILDKAQERAKANNRRTLFARDL